MGSYLEKPSTLEDVGSKHTRARLGSYGGVGLETNWYNSCIFLQVSLCLCRNLEGSQISVSQKLRMH